MSEDREVILIGFVNGWHLLDAKTMDVLQGPYDTHEEAERAAETRAYRIAQGWTP